MYPANFKMICLINGKYNYYDANLTNSFRKIKRQLKETSFFNKQFIFTRVKTIVLQLLFYSLAFTIFYEYIVNTRLLVEI